MNNYIPDTNRFKLAGPPAWFLRKLWEFDSSLAIVPSRQGFYYRLAQRRKLLIPAEKIAQDVLFNESDTKMLASYGLIPVTTILATCNWSNPQLFEELRRRSPERMGGFEKVTQMVEGQEFEEELKRRTATEELNAALAKDAWYLYQKKIGVRTHGFEVKTKPASQPESKAPAIRVTNKATPGVSTQTIFKG